MTRNPIFFILLVNAKALDKLGGKGKGFFVGISIMHSGGLRFVLFCFDSICFLMHEGCKMEKLQQMKEINSNFLIPDRRGVQGGE